VRPIVPVVQDVAKCIVVIIAIIIALYDLEGRRLERAQFSNNGVWCRLRGRDMIFLLYQFQRLDFDQTLSPPAAAQTG